MAAGRGACASCNEAFCAREALWQPHAENSTSALTMVAVRSASMHGPEAVKRSALAIAARDCTVQGVDRVLRIETQEPERRREAEALARELSLAMIEHDQRSVGKDALTLAMRDNGLELRDASTHPGRGLRIDFTHLAKRGRGVANLSRRQPLARAIGRHTAAVLDATAGLGQDAALLAAMGFHVTAAERHAILAAMLREALSRALQHEPSHKLLDDRLHMIHADAREVLNRRRATFDCVYLDPMFPPKRKASALAKKEIRLVRALVGDDPDARELLDVARASAKRVVVKRPTWAGPLANDVTASIAGKLTRYDVYTRAG